MTAPYFTTSDGVAVAADDIVYCIIYQPWASSRYFVVEQECKFSVWAFDPKRIFSTRAAAQAECDKLNQR